MTLQEKIKNLTWFNLVEKLKDILSGLGEGNSGEGSDEDNPIIKEYQANINNIFIVIQEGELEAGKKYIIMNLSEDDDFSNVGFVETGEPFIATGTTPNDWNNRTPVIDVLSMNPEVYMFKNTLGVKITWKIEVNKVTGQVEGLTGKVDKPLFKKEKVQIFSGSMDVYNMTPSYFYREDDYTIKGKGAFEKNVLTSSINIIIRE